jgi:hypothetical protein
VCGAHELIAALFAARTPVAIISFAGLLLRPLAFRRMYTYTTRYRFPAEWEGAGRRNDWRVTAVFLTG